MNIISKIEGATLVTIGAFCAAAITSILLHSANVIPAEQTVATSVIELPQVVVIGKRLSSVEQSSAASQHAEG